jgi:predicted O-methyltransferase YrrM
MDFLDPALEAYALQHSDPEPNALAELNRETNHKILMPRMLAGHYQGRLLSMIAHMIQPDSVLEIGTYTGYSAICFAEGLKPGGMVHTIDINEELATIQNKYIQQAGFRNSIVQYVGDALEIIPTITGNFDLVYLDADKENYCNYYDMVFPRVPSGGYIIADNVLWSGKVLNTAGDAETEALQEYNKKVAFDARVSRILLPVRDGLLIARKL